MIELGQTDECFLKEITSITVFYIYIDENNEIYSIKNVEEELDNNNFTISTKVFVIAKDKTVTLSSLNFISLLGLNILLLLLVF